MKAGAVTKCGTGQTAEHNTHRSMGYKCRAGGEGFFKMTVMLVDGV